ncbi:MAG: alkaline phosphatase D family protein [Pseudomonadota bacterium]
MPRNITRRELLTRVAPATAALAVSPTSMAAGSKIAFYHGVASGDPTQSAVILWTRVTTSRTEVDVDWEVSVNADFSGESISGSLLTSGSRDHTVKVDVDGLQAGTRYFYRFLAGDVSSPIGQTITLPEGELDSFKLGICSCSNYPAGYFNAYAAMADNPDLELVLHLGDYIYEYDADGYASANAEALGRRSEPLSELTELDDYRRRHAQYKSDKDLQRLHASLPFILSWDDHEVANDGWHGGADNHDKGEGDWQMRKAAALQAYYEWMPIRAPMGRANVDQWRSFEIGQLASLIMLETRLSARDPQVDIGRDLTYEQIYFDISNPGSPKRVAGSDAGDDVVSFNLPYDHDQKPSAAIEDYHRIMELSELEKLPKGIAYRPDMKAFTEQILDDPARQLLGGKQREFVAARLEQSAKQAKPWQLIGNQTLVAKVQTPNLAKALSPEEKDKISDFLKPAIPLTALGIPFGTDSWNGYGAEREWLLEQGVKNGSNMIVLTGDTHASWGLELQAESDANWQGFELGATSITSPGLPEAIGMTADRLTELLFQANANLRYSETAHHGYLSLTLTADSATAEFHRISTISEQAYQSAGSDSLSLRRRDAGKGIELQKT